MVREVRAAHRRPGSGRGSPGAGNALGAVFYGALPWIALGGSFGAVAILAPVAIAWHLTLAGAPRAP